LSGPSHPIARLPRPLAQMPNPEPSRTQSLLHHGMSLEALLRLDSSTLGTLGSQCLMSDRPDSRADYKPISDYGVIGDMHTAALVGLDGSIDWYCAPRFDSPSVFAALLDVRKGGKFQLSPTENSTTKQSYEGDTNVLSTIFESKQGRIKLTDFMPCFMEKGEAKGFQELHRIVDCVEGEAGLRIIFQPRLDYARGNTTLLETAEGCTAKNRGLQVN